jgi:cytoskeletal protein RodZ
VIDKGKVTGIVLDKDGKPVEGAKVTITASDGKTYTGTTGADGSFSINVYHGSFTWKISKSGFKAISGASTVNATGENELDLAGSPMLVEEKSGSVVLFIIIAAVVVLIVIGVIVFILMRKKKAPAEQAVEEAPQEYVPLPTEQAPLPEEPLQEDFMANAPPIEDNPEIPPDPLAEKISLQTMDKTYDTPDPPPVPYQEMADVSVDAPSEPAAPAPATPESTDNPTSP